MNNDKWYFDTVFIEEDCETLHFIVDGEGYIVIHPCRMSEGVARHIVQLHNKEIEGL